MKGDGTTLHSVVEEICPGLSASRSNSWGCSPFPKAAHLSHDQGMICCDRHDPVDEVAVQGLVDHDRDRGPVLVRYLPYAASIFAECASRNG